MNLEAAIDRQLVAKGTLYDFVECAWPIVEPSPFVANWHLDEICQHLEAVSSLAIRYLVINIPPGTGKSLLTGVFWPVWEWIFRPEQKFFYASFDASLVCRDAGKMIKLMRSPWFVDRWGSFLSKGNLAESDFDNTTGGFRFSTSIGGKGTGRHGNIKVIDDPLKPKDALGGVTLTKNALKAASDWMANTLSSRMADPVTDRRVIVQQRIHEEDPAGEAIESGDYEVLRLPMRYDANQPCVTSVGGDRRTVEGELLFPARYPEQVVAKLEKDMGEDVAAAQLQQAPKRKGGNIFRKDWWRYWSPNGEIPGTVALPKYGLRMQSWDMAFKGKDHNDFVCGQVWLSTGPQFFLQDLINERLDFTRSLTAIRAMAIKYPDALDKLVEDAANGPAIESTLKLEIQGVTLCTPMGGKEARAHAVTPLFQAGCVYLPHPSLAPWVKAYEHQLEIFPNGKNDDMVDATTQALIRLRQFGNSFSEAMRRIRGEK